MCLERVFINKNAWIGLSKQQVSDLFNSQEELGNISPLTAIEKFSGAHNGKIQADFYDDCQDIPDAENLLLLDDCFLGKQNKAKSYYTRGRHNNCDTKTISDYLVIQFKKIQTIL